MIATIIVLSFMGAVSYVYLTDLARVEHFRRNIHQGDVVTCHLRKNVFTAIVKKVPGLDRVVIADIDFDQNHTVSIHCIYPL